MAKRIKNITNAFDGTVWFVPEKKKAFVLRQADIWQYNEHKDKEGFELLDAIEKGEKPYTIVCFHFRGNRFLHIYTAEDTCEKTGISPGKAYGIKIESLSMVNWRMENGKLVGEIGSVVEKKTEQCNLLGFLKGGWEHSPTEIKYWGNINSRDCKIKF